MKNEAADYYQKVVNISEAFLAGEYSLFEAKAKIRALNGKYAESGFKKMTGPIGAGMARDIDGMDFPASSYYPAGHEQEGELIEDEDGDTDGWVPSTC